MGRFFFIPLSLPSKHLFIQILSDVTHYHHATAFILSFFMCQPLSAFCCRTAVTSTASRTAGTQHCTAPVAEVRWTLCGCCWKAGRTVASRTTTMTPLSWWPRTTKWVTTRQQKKQCIIKKMSHFILSLLFVCFMAVSVCFQTIHLRKQRNLFEVSKLTVTIFLV